MKLFKTRIWIGILGLSLSCLAIELLSPHTYKRFLLSYTNNLQQIDLGEVQAANYQIRALNITHGGITGYPKYKIEIFNSNGVLVYSHIHEHTYGEKIPDFIVSQTQFLRATVALTDPQPIADSMLALSVKPTVAIIHNYIFWFGICGTLASAGSLLFLRKRRSHCQLDREI